MISGAKSPHDGGAQAQILEQLISLAISQRRLEGALAHISKKQVHASDVADKMAADLQSVLDKVTMDSSTVVAKLSPDSTGKKDVGPLHSSGRQTDVHVPAWASERSQVSPPEPTGGGEAPALELAMSDVGVGLPQGWPSSVAVRADLAVHRSEVFGLKRSGPSASTHLRLEGPGDAAGLRRGRGAFQRVLIDPNTNLYTVFTFCSTTVLMYDLWVVPFLIAWELPFTGFAMVASIGVACFWTLDVLVNFLSGYQRGGAVVMDPCLVARRYVSTWFLPDIVVVASDWLSIVLVMASQGGNHSTEILGTLRFTKLSRLLRLMAIMRMVKLIVVIQKYIEKVWSDSHQFVLKLASLLCGTLWLAHILACLFYWLGHNAPSNTGARWIDNVSGIGDRSIAFLEEDAAYQYITSFHWAVAQITLGSMEISVGNTVERLFCIFTLLLGLLFGATMVSSLSASIIDYQMLAKDKTEKLRLLRRYLRENHVDHHVAHLVAHQARERLWEKARLAAEEVHVLKLVSLSLRTELHFGLCRRHVIRHPLFRFWTDIDASMARHFCYECVSFDFPMHGDEVFLPGTVADTSYFVISGKLNYTQVPGSSPATELETTSVGAGQWLCEAAVWSRWTHVGTLQAQTKCQLLVVSGKGLDSVLQRNRTLRDVTSEYCRHFHARITSAKPPHAPWPNDISVPFTEYGDIVVCMDEAVQTTIGLAAVEHMMPSWGGHRGLEKLREEVQQGKSTMIIDGNGDSTRIVPVVVMRIERGDGSIWAQLGEQKHSDVACACQLPGMKQQHGELVGETAMRILEHMGLGEQDVEILGTERSDAQKESKQYGIRTKYLRTECRARLRSDSSTRSMEAERLPEEGRRRRRESTCSSHSSNPDPARIHQRDIFVRRRGDKTFFFAWLAPTELGQLQKPAGEAILAAWLARRPRRGSADNGGDSGGDAASRRMSFSV